MLVPTNLCNLCSAFKNTTGRKTLSLVASSSIQIYHSNCFISPVGVNLFWKKHFLSSTTCFLNPRSSSLQSMVDFFHWSHDKLHSRQEITPTLIYDSSSQFCSRNSPKNPQSWNSPLFNTSTIGFLSFNSPPPPGWNFIQVGIESRSHTLDLVVWHTVSFLVYRTGGPFDNVRVFCGKRLETSKYSNNLTKFLTFGLRKPIIFPKANPLLPELFFNFHGLRGVESEENAGNIKIQSFFIRDVSKWSWCWLCPIFSYLLAIALPSP